MKPSLRETNILLNALDLYIEHTGDTINIADLQSKIKACEVKE